MKSEDLRLPENGEECCGDWSSSEKEPAGVGHLVSKIDFVCLLDINKRTIAGAVAALLQGRIFKFPKV